MLKESNNKKKNKEWEGKTSLSVICNPCWKEVGVGVAKKKGKVIILPPDLCSLYQRVSCYVRYIAPVLIFCHLKKRRLHKY